jgi:hypothetical protein
VKEFEMNGMKTNTIKLVLNHKLKAWIKTITDADVAALVSRNAIVSGGAIASMLSGDKVNDYDIYFRDLETTEAVARYYVNLFNATNGKLASKAMAACNPEVRVEDRVNVKGVTEKRVVIYMKSAGVASETQSEYDYFETRSESSTDEFFDSLKADPVEVAEELVTIVKDKKESHRAVFFSENAITLSEKIQLVMRFYGSPSEIHENYDFAHSMCHYDFGAGELTLHPEALECILSKTLVYKGSLYPVASMFRTRKFIGRGWRISAGQMLKIMVQLSGIDLLDKTILREQLLGVDQAYMSQLMRALESKDAAQRVDQTYLAKLVDQIFE